MGFILVAAVDMVSGSAEFRDALYQERTVEAIIPKKESEDAIVTGAGRSQGPTSLAQREPTQAGTSQAVTRSLQLLPPEDPGGFWDSRPESPTIARTDLPSLGYCLHGVGSQEGTFATARKARGKKAPVARLHVERLPTSSYGTKRRSLHQLEAARPT